ncbi:amidohydrolase [Candidatus Pantoea soli]|uniref:Amidohydrolase n=1 Tax=Candidatus Pantoea soli TaxID=3098669 RepID=A0A518XHY9_9GAMM|nr:amidohydrolase [Pantoea soli]QDY43817.1 amidohydrolase [Pantoea soli]
MSLFTESALGDYLVALRHELHRFPELSNQETETTARLRRQLMQHQIRLLDVPLKTGLIAEVGPSQGPLIVLRGDIDALPIEEQSDVAFRSEHPGVMHACGHDFHSAAVLGAAILLKQQEAQLPGRVRLVFQAAEETGLGAPEVIATGALQDAVAIFGIHNDPSLPAGVIGSKAGPLTAAVDRFDITLTGTGSHAAKPHEGNDPIVIAAQLISAVQTLISRNAPSAENAVVSITQIHSGSTWNVIPDSAWLEGTVRSFSAATRARITQRFHEIVQGIGAAYAARVTLNWHAGPPSVMNDAHWAEFALQQAAASGFTPQVVAASPIGEDFAFYQQQLPGAFLMIGTGEPYALHHPAFRINDAVLLPTARYLAALATAALHHAEQP